MSFAGGGRLGEARFCRTGGLNRPSGHLSARSVSFSKYAGCCAGQTGTASGRGPLVRLHLLSRFGARLNKFGSLGAHCRHTLTLLTAGVPPRYPSRPAARRRLRRLLAASHPSYPILIFATALTVFVFTPFGATSGLCASPGKRITKSPG